MLQMCFLLIFMMMYFMKLHRRKMILIMLLQSVNRMKRRNKHMWRKYNHHILYNQKKENIWKTEIQAYDLK